MYLRCDGCHNRRFLESRPQIAAHRAAHREHLHTGNHHRCVVAGEPGCAGRDLDDSDLVGVPAQPGYVGIED